MALVWRFPKLMCYNILREIREPNWFPGSGSSNRSSELWTSRHSLCFLATICWTDPFCHKPRLGCVDTIQFPKWDWSRGISPKWIKGILFSWFPGVLCYSSKNSIWQKTWPTVSNACNTWMKQCLSATLLMSGTRHCKIAVWSHQQNRRLYGKQNGRMWSGAD